MWNRVFKKVFIKTDKVVGKHIGNRPSDTRTNEERGKQRFKGILLLVALIIIAVLLMYFEGR